MIAEQKKQLLLELLKDSSLPQKVLADRVGVSTTKMTRMISELKNDGIIKRFTADLDYQKLGYATVGYFICTQKEKTGTKDQETIDFISKIHGVLEVSQVNGKDIDLIAKILTHDNEEFKDVVDKIRSCENVDNAKSYSAIAYHTQTNGPRFLNI